MNKAIEQSINDVKKEISFAVVSTNDRDAMLRHLQECADRSIPCLFDPGQQINNFSVPQLSYALELADYVIVNEHEYSLLKEMTGLSDKGIDEQIEGVIITLGNQGSTFRNAEQMIHIPSIKTEIVDRS